MLLSVQAPACFPVWALMRQLVKASQWETALKEHP
jgi:hypothetical protein